MVFEVGDPVIVGSALFLAVGAFRGLYETWRRKRTIETTVTPDAASVEAGEYAEVRGTVRLPAGGDLLASPIRRRDCAFAAWAIDEYHGHEWASGGGWTEQVEDYETVPFLVDDGTGQVLVDVDGDYDPAEFEVWFELSAYDDIVEEVGPEESAPPHLRELVESRDEVECDREMLFDFDYPHGYRRFREACLTPGDEVYVAGQAVDASRTGHGSGASVAIEKPDGGEKSHFVVTDQDEAELARRTTRVSWLLLLVGVGLVLWALDELTVGLLPLLRSLG